MLGTTTLKTAPSSKWILPVCFTQHDASKRSRELRMETRILRTEYVDFDVTCLLCMSLARLMSVSGFTQMATEVDAVELIDLLNVFFMHIDHASAYIGNIWKVETIGEWSRSCLAV